jgi:hypothetical protein
MGRQGALIEVVLNASFCITVPAFAKNKFVFLIASILNEEAGIAQSV